MFVLFDTEEKSRERGRDFVVCVVCVRGKASERENGLRGALLPLLLSISGSREGEREPLAEWYTAGFSSLVCLPLCHLSIAGERERVTPSGLVVFGLPKCFQGVFGG